jgi:hypothetical protein
MTLLKHDPSAQRPWQKTIAGLDVEGMVVILFWLNRREGKSCFR